MRRFFTVLLLTFLAASGSGCGYSLAGRGSFLPASIKTIGVPVFTNRTPVFNLETQLTQKVRSEFISRGKYKPVPESTGVDALLTGTVLSAVYEPAALNEDNVASKFVLTMTANVELRDLKDGKILWRNPGLIFRQEYDVQTGAAASDPNAFFGQNANALDRMTTEFARAIVSAILEAF